MEVAVCGCLRLVSSVVGGGCQIFATLTLYVVRVTKRCDIGYVTFRKEHHKESSQHQKT